MTKVVFVFSRENAYVDQEHKNNLCFYSFMLLRYIFVFFIELFRMLTFFAGHMWPFDWDFLLLHVHCFNMF